MTGNEYDIDTTELDKLEENTFPYEKRTEIPAKLLKQMISQSKDLRSCLNETFEGDFKEFNQTIFGEYHDLNQDGVNDLIVNVENSCGGHNVPTYVFQITNNRFKSLLQTTSIGLKLKKNKTNGFHDLLVSTHGTCCSGGYDLYKFSKGKYRLNTCYVWETIKMNDGKEKAQVKPRNCNESY